MDNDAHPVNQSKGARANSLTAYKRCSTMDNTGLMFQIAKFRRARGLTQEELADKIGSTQANLSEIVRGVHMPSIETLRKVAEVFDMEIVDLFEKSDVAQAESEIVSIFSKLDADEKKKIIEIARILSRKP